MVKGYNKNQYKIENKPQQPELTQTQKRKRKLSDLKSRKSSWQGLESYKTNNEKKTFQTFINECEERGHVSRKRKKIDDELKNIYNSTQHLDYNKWLEFMKDEYKGLI